MVNKNKVMIVSTKPYDDFIIGNMLANYGFVLMHDHYNADVVLAIGGDSAVLKASRYGLPILAWNQGHLGFLTTGSDLDEILNMYINSNLITDRRMVLSITIDGEKYTALNEIAIVGTETGRLVETDVYINDRQITTYKGDGLIVATPTGSTAWSLSAGGSLVEASLQCMLITPMNPFTMNVRPLIISSSHKVVLKKVEKVVIDGHNIIKPQNNTIAIEFNRYFVQLYRIKHENFFRAITEKLGWNNNIKR